MEPADAKDRLRRRLLWRLVNGLYLLGSRLGEERNLMTCSWVTQVCATPKLVGVGVEAGAVTRRLVGEGRGFALSMLRREDRALVRRYVKPAAHDAAARTLGGAPYEDAPVTGAPVLASAAAWIDCTLHSAIELGSHVLFVGEVADIGCDDQSFEILRMEDTLMNYGG